MDINQKKAFSIIELAIATTVMAIIFIATPLLVAKKQTAYVKPTDNDTMIDCKAKYTDANNNEQTISHCIYDSKALTLERYTDNDKLLVTETVYDRKRNKNEFYQITLRGGFDESNVSLTEAEETTLALPGLSANASINNENGTENTSTTTASGGISNGKYLMILGQCKDNDCGASRFCIYDEGKSDNCGYELARAEGAIPSKEKVTRDSNQSEDRITRITIGDKNNAK